MLVATLSGCARYLTPGGPASIPEITQPDIAEALARQPASPFPARIIVARVQASGYRSASSESYGRGNFSVVTARDIESEQDFVRLGAMPSVAGVGVLSRVLLPSDLNSAKDLRTAAAQLRGDVILLYTLDTAFRTDKTPVGPLQLVSLGFFPSYKSHVTATCAAAFVDVRTGFVYGVAEFSASEQQRSDLWSTETALETARHNAERQAFNGALQEIEKSWGAILTEHAGKATVAAQR